MSFSGSGFLLPFHLGVSQQLLQANIAGGTQDGLIGASVVLIVPVSQSHLSLTLGWQACRPFLQESAAALSQQQ